jgi:hypothetical protein
LLVLLVLLVLLRVPMLLLQRVLLYDRLRRERRLSLALYLEVRDGMLQRCAQTLLVLVLVWLRLVLLVLLVLLRLRLLVPVLVLVLVLRLPLYGLHLLPPLLALLQRHSPRSSSTAPTGPNHAASRSSSAIASVNSLVDLAWRQRLPP